MKRRIAAVLAYFLVCLCTLAVVVAPAAPQKPVLMLTGETLHWTSIEGVTQYEIQTRDLTDGTKTTWTFSSVNEAPATVVEGHTLGYRVRARYGFANEAPYSNKVDHTWPEVAKEEREAKEKAEREQAEREAREKAEREAKEKAEREQAEREAREKAEREAKEKAEKELKEKEEAEKAAARVIGLNGEGFSEAEREKTHKDGFLSQRLEAGSGTSLGTSLARGYSKDEVIVGNINDGTKIGSINLAEEEAKTLAQIGEDETLGGVVAFEFMNEPYFKGKTAEPAAYAKLYLNIVTQAVAKGYKTPICYNSRGDYFNNSTNSWSQLAASKGWIGDSLAAQPGLKSAVQCWVYHTYGRKGENVENNAGTGSLEAQHNEQVSLGFTHLLGYVTETGIQIGPEAYNASPTEAGQAAAIKGDYEAFTALPYIKGIWYYQLHDEGIGKYGLVGEGFKERPAYGIVQGYTGVTKTASSSCFANPAGCGFPASTTAGVQSCSSLPKTGNVALAANQTLSGKLVEGYVKVEGSNAKVVNSCVVKHGGFGDQSVFLENGVKGFVIENSTVHGANSTNEFVEEALTNNYASGIATARNVYLYNCGECLHGEWTVENSYVISNGGRGQTCGAGCVVHFEDIFFNGNGEGKVTLLHDTLLNPEKQSAVVFGESNPCSTHLTIEKSLLAGAGYVIYPCAHATSAGSSSTTITNNRFARCKTAAISDPAGGGGYVCSGGPDKFGYYPGGGWSNATNALQSSGFTPIGPSNVWDDNGQPVS